MAIMSPVSMIPFNARFVGKGVRGRKGKGIELPPSSPVAKDFSTGFRQKISSVYGVIWSRQ